MIIGYSPYTWALLSAMLIEYSSYTWARYSAMIKSTVHITGNTNQIW